MKFFVVLAALAVAGLAAPITPDSSIAAPRSDANKEIARAHDQHHDAETVRPFLHNRMFESAAVGKTIASVADQKAAAKLMSSASGGSVTYDEALRALEGKSSDIVAAVKSASSKKLAVVMKFNDEANTMTVADKLDALSSASFKSQTAPEVEVSLRKALKASQSPSGTSVGDGAFSQAYDAAAADVKATGQKAAAAATDFQQLQAIKDFKAKQAAKAAKQAAKNGATTN